MIRISEIIEKVQGYMPQEGIALIQKAYVFSASAHAGQTRRSGEPYLSHPLEVANILADMKMDEDTIVAGLLHDTVEDTKISIEEVDSLFGEEVADIVDGVTKLGKMSFESKEDAQAESIRKMILAMAENISVLIVKLADRLHNMRTLEFMPQYKQKLISQETIDIYAPLANRLGLHRIKTELEDLGLKYIRPDVYFQLFEGVSKRQTVGIEYVKKVTGILRQLLEDNLIKGRVHGRNKHLMSVYRKMQQQNLPLEQIFDLIAFRVIVNSVKDCYTVLGLVHNMWKPIPGRFKDYISMPKANMYQSLHTTVIGPDAERIEIQIRTMEMHRVAEYGVAAHWLYKEGGRVKDKDVGSFGWLREIVDWQKQEDNPREFIRSLRFDLFKDEVYVFTPNGQVKELPEGATPVDFAYLIHTEIGDHCTGAKVNGRLVTLNSELHNGDTVEIITDAHRRPSRDWLKFVKTAKARTRINHYIRNEERSRSIALAKELLEKEGRRMGINITKAFKEHKFDELAKEFSFGSSDQLLSAVGYSRLTPKKVLKRLQLREEEKNAPQESVAVEPVEEKAAEAPRTKGSDKIKIEGVDDVLIHFAKCCNPVMGDNIIGYISHGRGLTVHTSDCPNVQNFEPERLIQVSWDGLEQESYHTKIRILCKNIRGVLAKISTLLADQGLNIDSGQFRSNVDSRTLLHFTVETTDAKQLYETLEKLNSMDFVLEAVRE